MVSYTTNNRLAKMADGELQHAWGTPYRATQDMLDEALDGVQAITGTQTLTTANNATDQSRKRRLTLTGAGGTTTLPDVAKWYILTNSATGAQTFRPTGAGTQVVIPAGMDGIVMHDGTNCSFLRTDYDWKLLSTATTNSGTTQTITIDRTSYFTEFQLVFHGLRHNGGGVETLYVDFVRTSGAYPGATTMVLGPNGASATDFDGAMMIVDRLVSAGVYTGQAWGTLASGLSNTATTAIPITAGGQGLFALNWGGTGVRFSWNSGASFTAGSIELWGR